MRTLFIFLLSIAMASAATVRLAWNASPSPDVDGYRIKWGFAQGGPYPHPVEAGQLLTVTIDEPWAAGTHVFFTAYAFNVAGESLPSNEVEFVVPMPTPVPTPTPTPAPTPAPPSNLQLFLEAIARWLRGLSNPT
jgi:hypothetical protein